MPYIKVVILGAGLPYAGEKPSALKEMPGHHIRVLDWIINSFAIEPSAEFHFIGGYRLEDVIQTYQQIRFSVNPDWQNSGSLWSLFLAPILDADILYVTYADIVYRPSIVESVHKSEGSISVVVDTKWKSRYAQRTKEDIDTAEKAIIKDGKIKKVGQNIDEKFASGEFVGLMKISGEPLSELKKMSHRADQKYRFSSLPELMSEYIDIGYDIDAVQVEGDWAELNASQDLARFLLGTKAITLERIRPLLKTCVIDDQIAFTIDTWEKNSQIIIEKIKNRYQERNIVVRSSALNEDGWSQSAAGKYLSILNVCTDDSNVISEAVNKVRGSYSDTNGGHQILVQAMLNDILISGVVFTRTANHGAPYYVVNYDDTTTSTETVTSGTGTQLKTCLVHKSHWTNFEPSNRILKSVLLSANELENLIGHDCLDIEFAVTADETIHILQIRPITIVDETYDRDDDKVKTALNQCVIAFISKKTRRPFLYGDHTIFGLMPDWNPAEIIGPRPEMLAFTIYQYLITDEIWAKQRKEYGYRDVRPCPLMTSFAGHPYVDIRASFNSFIPASLADDLANKLVNHYLSTLELYPQYHDKIEFEIVFTCLTFDFDEQARKKLLNNRFSENDIKQLKDALLPITKGAFERCKNDLNTIKLLEQRFESITDNNQLDPLDKAILLLDDAKEYGTLPFAHLARSAFVATSLLRSLQAKRILSAKQITLFLNSFNSVTRQFEADGIRVKEGEMSWNALLRKYGHLRPGTYSITSPNYVNDPERFLSPIISNDVAALKSSNNMFLLPDETRALIEQELRALKLNYTEEQFFSFLREAIEGREYSKFIFTKNLSLALELIAEFGKSIGLNRESLSHLSIFDLIEIHRGLRFNNRERYLKNRSLINRRNYSIAKCVELPPLITSPEDFFYFELPLCQPNFVSQKQIIEESIEYSLLLNKIDDIHQKIILIPQADPGFDWLFGHNIAGLITMFGGANSHMTIRAAELGIPAAIGVGQSLYEKLSMAKMINLDCASRRIEIIR